MNAKERGMYQHYLNATMFTLDDAYERPSRYKMNAYEHCMVDAFMLNGHDIRIPSRNTFGFTFAFMFEKDEKQMMYYATKDNKYIFEVE